MFERISANVESSSALTTIEAADDRADAVRLNLDFVDDLLLLIVEVAHEVDGAGRHCQTTFHLLFDLSFAPLVDRPCLLLGQAGETHHGGGHACSTCRLTVKA